MPLRLRSAYACQGYSYLHILPNSERTIIYSILNAWYYGLRCYERISTLTMLQ